jgi:hypothetical protein
MDENNGLGVDFKVTSYPADINGMTHDIKHVPHADPQPPNLQKMTRTPPPVMCEELMTHNPVFQDPKHSAPSSACLPSHLQCAFFPAFILLCINKPPSWKMNGTGDRHAE